jgi:hypothetical protein
MVFIPSNLKDEVADCSEEPALENERFYSNCGRLDAASIARSILAAKVPESSDTLIAIMTGSSVKVAACNDYKLKKSEKTQSSGADAFSEISCLPPA